MAQTYNLGTEGPEAEDKGFKVYWRDGSGEECRPLLRGTEVRFSNLPTLGCSQPPVTLASGDPTPLTSLDTYTKVCVRARARARAHTHTQVYPHAHSYIIQNYKNKSSNKGGVEARRSREGKRERAQGPLLGQLGLAEAVGPPGLEAPRPKPTPPQAPTL